MKGRDPIGQYYGVEGGGTEHPCHLWMGCTTLPATSLNIKHRLVQDFIIQSPALLLPAGLRWG